MSAIQPSPVFHVYANGFGYNDKGQPDRMRLGNGLWESIKYNNKFQVTQFGLGTSQSNANRLKIEYEYGEIDGSGNLDITKNNGNVARQKITVPAVGSSQGFAATQSYYYDELNRIKSAVETEGASQTNWQQVFKYDRYGNRMFDTSNNNTTTLPENFDPNVYNPTFNTANNRMADNQGYEYDSAGNVTKDATNKRFVYDGENKQTSFGTGSSSTNGGSCFYDGDGKRVKKKVGEITTIFVYNASGQMVAEYTATAPTNPTISYLTSDTLGSPRINTDASGQVSARHDYMPFGEEIIGLGNRTSSNGYQDDDIRQKFTDYERDDESGLDFAQARYYSSAHGRFTTVDPLMASARIGSPKTLNRYTYALNNPLRFIDPTGLDATEDEHGKFTLKHDFHWRAYTYTPIMAPIAPSNFFLAKIGMPDYGISYEEVEVGQKDIVYANDEVNKVVNTYMSAVYTNEITAGSAYDAMTEAKGSATLKEINLGVGVDFGLVGEKGVKGSAEASATFAITDTSDIDAARRDSDSKLSVDAMNTLRSIKTVATGSPDTPRNLTDQEITQILSAARQRAVSQANTDLNTAKKVRENSENGIRQPK